MNTRQQGVALLVVLLILVLMVTVAAVITERNGRTYHRTVAQVEKLQANWYVRAAEAMAQKILQRDKQDSPQKMYLAQNWAQTKLLFQSEEEDGVVRGQIVDAQACFNLNSIQGDDIIKNNNVPYPAKVFQQLLINLQIEPLRATQITTALRNRLNTENSSVTGSQLMQDVSELRMIAGVDANLYRTLLPYVCVLPTSILLVNINTLQESQEELLAALFLKDQHTFLGEKLLQQRPRMGWDSVATFLELSQLKEIDTAAVIPNLTVNSDYFITNLYVVMGYRQFSIHNLIIWKEKYFHIVQRKYGLSIMVAP